MLITIFQLQFNVSPINIIYKFYHFEKYRPMKCNILTARNRFEYRYYVLQFSQSGRFPDWCGYGPSEDLKNCTTDGGSDQGATDSDSESEESDAVTKLEPGPGEATGAGEGARVGSNQGVKPAPPANADKGGNTGPGTSI